MVGGGGLQQQYQGDGIRFGNAPHQDPTSNLNMLVAQMRSEVDSLNQERNSLLATIEALNGRNKALEAYLEAEKVHKARLETQNQYFQSELRFMRENSGPSHQPTQQQQPSSLTNGRRQPSNPSTTTTNQTNPNTNNNLPITNEDIKFEQWQSAKKNS